MRVPRQRTGPPAPAVPLSLITQRLREDLEDAVRPHLALAPEGEAWVYGSFFGTQQFGTFTLTAATGSDSVLLRLAP